MTVVAPARRNRDRPRSRRGEGVRLRAEILAAATELLDASGDERAVTLRAVARRVGIAAPSIYPHFPDRPAIVLAVARQGFAELGGRIRSATGSAGDDPRARLIGACRAYVDFADRRPARYRLMFGRVHDPEDPTAVGGEAVRILTETLTDCVAAGRSTSTDLRADAISLWVGLHGLAHQHAVAALYPWPPDIVRRVAAPLSRLVVT
ncbi:TetR/AcrR family transcriptional regulator [Pseudonocardia adelaidensis]|uniref:TetR/AcrR family transcriptional regulator n=1 Tax=Pseudonocardia adelaidensis TaxID=648754 RepID=A0ABP9NP02_9PSEU